MVKGEVLTKKFIKKNKKQKKGESLARRCICNRGNNFLVSVLCAIFTNQDTKGKGKQNMAKPNRPCIHKKKLAPLSNKDHSKRHVIRLALHTHSFQAVGFRNIIKQIIRVRIRRLLRRWCTSGKPSLKKVSGRMWHEQQELPSIDIIELDHCTYRVPIFCTDTKSVCLNIRDSIHVNMHSTRELVPKPIFVGYDRRQGKSMLAVKPFWNSHMML